MQPYIIYKGWRYHTVGIQLQLISETRLNVKKGVREVQAEWEKRLVIWYAIYMCVFLFLLLFYCLYFLLLFDGNKKQLEISFTRPREKHNLPIAIAQHSKTNNHIKPFQVSNRDINHQNPAKLYTVLKKKYYPSATRKCEGYVLKVSSMRRLSLLFAINSPFFFRCMKYGYTLWNIL